MAAKQRKPAVAVRNFKELYEKDYGVVLGRTREITPKQLFEIALEYFRWAENNAIHAAETASFQGEVEESLVFKTRIFTLNGFSLFSGISNNSLARYRKEEHYGEVMEFVDKVINEQKYQLAANGVINASFIGKELGIDKPMQVNVENSASAESNSVATTEKAMKDAVESILENL